MGDSQETFEAILGFMHREHIDPDYLSRHIYMPHDNKFAFDNKLDDIGCSPKCAAHLTFGIETTDLIACS